MIETAKLQRIIEGALLAAGKPVPLEKLEELFIEGEKPEREQLEEALKVSVNPVPTVALS